MEYLLHKDSEIIWNNVKVAITGLGLHANVEFYKLYRNTFIVLKVMYAYVPKMRLINFSQVFQK